MVLHVITKAITKIIQSATPRTKSEPCPVHPSEGHYITLLSYRTSGEKVFKMLPSGHCQHSPNTGTQDTGYFRGRVLHKCNGKDVPRVIE